MSYQPLWDCSVRANLDSWGDYTAVLPHLLHGYACLRVSVVVAVSSLYTELAQRRKHLNDE